MPLYQTVCPTPLPVETVEQCHEAARAFRRDGMVVIKLLSQKQCEDLIIEQWQNIIDRQPLLPEYKLLHPEPEFQRDAFLEYALRENLSAAELKARENAWPLHVTFGACCDNESFHSQKIWDVRQHPGASTFLALGRPDIWVDINRSIQKLPGKGEDEFLHWDFNAFDPANADPTAQPRAIGGRVGYNPFSTILAPGSQTPDFFAKFQTQYAHLYPHLSRTGARNAKTGLDVNKADPMNLFGDENTDTSSSWAAVIDVPAGCWLVWDERMLHGTVKNPRKNATQYGMYLGYAPAQERPRYEQISGVSEMTDRMDSFLSGTAPRLWPSLDPISYMPRRFLNFPRPVYARMERMPPGNAITTWRTIASGKQLPSFQRPPPDPDYRPPNLTPNGWRLLVGDKNHGYHNASLQQNLSTWLEY